MSEPTEFRILIIDDNPAIHLDFQKILKTKRATSSMQKLSQLIFADEPQSPLSSELDTLPTFQIDWASQGAEGIQRIQHAIAQGTPYALAFVDIRMPPGFNGIETIKQIWALDQEIQVVICTAYSDYTWEETVEELGLRDNLLILKKPFDSVSVRQLACSLTKKWRLMQESKNREQILEATVKERTHSLQETLSILEHQATHDSLTNLPNRVLLVDRIKQEIARAKRNNSMFSLIFIDLDRFKLINDSFNHETGDFLLKTIAERLISIARETDTIARLSGDEFIFISGAQEQHHIEEKTQLIANKILNAINEPLPLANRNIMISASIGISIYPLDGTAIEDLLRHADLAMYRAKALGGNQLQFYAPALQKQCRTLLERETELHRALIHNEFFLEYQPQYNLKDHKLIGVEALIRWQHPQRGVLLPMDFIPLAEDTGLILPIGEWLIHTACSQNKTWQDKGIPPFSVSISITTKQFMQPNFIAMIKNILNATRLAPKYLQIEVTESVLINTANVAESIKELKRLGINIVLDDFGTGNSGFNYLHKLPIDQLKIDQSFIQNIGANRSDEVIIQAIIDMANNLHLDVLAEGIETLTQLEFLQSRDCDKVQGYYFNKPMSTHQFEALLNNIAKP